MRHANGYGTVYKLKGNRRRPYTAVVVTGLREDGKYNRQTLGYYATREEGLAALADYHASPYDASEKSAPLKEFYAAYKKGWKSYQYNHGWVEYEGSDPSSIDGVQQDKANETPIYNLNGQRLDKPCKGINIIGGKKILVK